MLSYQRAFLDLAVQCGALRFGEFKLKSGRVSPYFFNAGLFDNGKALAVLGKAYAQAAQQSGVAFDMLFGPAYKGIALAAATAIALSDEHQCSVPFAFNRKEVKAHGEGGTLIGARLHGRVLIVDDVITAGTAVRESLEIIRAHGATPAGVLIALDRQERGQGELSAAQDVAREFSIPVIAIAQLDDLLSFVHEQTAFSMYREQLLVYRQTYGTQG